MVINILDRLYFFNVRGSIRWVIGLGISTLLFLLVTSFKLKNMFTVGHNLDGSGVVMGVEHDNLC